MHIREERAWDSLESDIIIIILTTFEFVDQSVEGEKTLEISDYLLVLVHLQLEIYVGQLLLSRCHRAPLARLVLT